ncbi:ATP-dependent RNA helicase DDX55/SPB4 [Paragonimus heterotremus]|uniref:ATP-dependent RNA helicase DDX55/SPB4 n=1 Tax=Paragonimus heterotremus TaxID=100268 RepID=A0A8J4WJW1_9TREM|nr:ATP-dependent RNA helicase DDX55/SPB4 [Paragonimus heterotremus]
MTELLQHFTDENASMGHLLVDDDLTKASPAVLASFTVYARPELLTQLFCLVDALKDSAGRFKELSTRLWKHMFEPWLERVPYTSGSSKSDKEWPVLRTTYFDLGSTSSVDAEDCGTDEHQQPQPQLLPGWRLELVAPTSSVDENANFITDSCDQLVSTFQGLFTHVFSLRTPNIRSTNIVREPPIDTCFDEQLVAKLIEGRFAVVLPSAKQCRSVNFLAPVTQAVFGLAVRGKETGFFTGAASDEDLREDSSDERTIDGGSTLLFRWIHDLSRLTEKRRCNEILSKVRSLLADAELFRSTELVGTKKCPKADSQNNSGQLMFADDDVEALPDDQEMQAYEHIAIAVADTPDGKRTTHKLPTLTQILESNTNRKYLARFLDLGHFHFPLCKISKAIPSFMELIQSILVEAESYMSRSAPRDAHEKVELDATSRTDSLALAAAVVELVPRMIMSYTSLVPCLHATELEKDLYLASLYHNNCMFLAHECLTLGELRLYPLLARLQSGNESTTAVTHEQSLERLAAVSTCILVPHLRTAGTNMLLRHLRRIREQLMEELSQAARGFRDLHVLENKHRTTQAMHACFDVLRTTSTGLWPLPITVYYRCMGVLCNNVCTELTCSILQLIDLTTPDCDVLVEILKEVEVEISQYFDPQLSQQHSNDPETTKGELFVGLLDRRVPELSRLRGILDVLTASSLVAIENLLWDNGNGPLAVEAHLKASELCALIEAIYSHSPMRDKFISKLR